MDHHILRRIRFMCVLFEIDRGLKVGGGVNCEQRVFRILVWTGADLRSMQSVRLGQGDDDAEPVSDITDICRAATPEAHEK